MPRVTRIDRADAFKAIEAVIARGEAPTHINVRAELGQRGSPPVISNFIGSWFACYGADLAQRAADADASAPAQRQGVSASTDGGSIAALTAAALEEIQRAASSREAAHQRSIEAANDELAKQQQALAERIAAFQQQEQGAQAHVQRCYSDRDTALAERDRALADAATLRQALGEAKAQLVILQLQAEQFSAIAERLAQLEARLPQI
ncbi:hypothetical protein ABB30_04900 [Stenotrophomonas ginsengisoli]|uniref:KfrA N-terminal DNA-binding domain-containing protein n=1 Tax=Stenotrophomonas ginsengisoli TaxID=336566 RepID=A0A0R0DH56_9GAMM|nr:DNA-binding protein [Stenotrophomonas ginsengisoli]KRG78066.1 hypothetical protein ABB30_04900 [Stenotrophomonas ginsengisoli]